MTMQMTMWHRTRPLVMAAELAVGVAALGAHAESEDTNSAPNGCPVDNVNDTGETVTTTPVPNGVRSGLVHCENGDWKFGTGVATSGGRATGGRARRLRTRSRPAARSAPD